MSKIQHIPDIGMKKYKLGTEISPQKPFCV